MRDTRWSGFYTSADIQSVHSTASADWAKKKKKDTTNNNNNNKDK